MRLGKGIFVFDSFWFYFVMYMDLVNVFYFYMTSRVFFFSLGFSLLYVFKTILLLAQKDASLGDLYILPLSCLRGLVVFIVPRMTTFCTLKLKH